MADMSHPMEGENPALPAVDAGTLPYRPAQTIPPPGASRPPLGWGLALVPPLVAVACWPIFFLIFFVMSFTLALMAVAACLIWHSRPGSRAFGQGGTDDC